MMYLYIIGKNQFIIGGDMFDHDFRLGIIFYLLLVSSEQLFVMPSFGDSCFSWRNNVKDGSESSRR